LSIYDSSTIQLLSYSGTTNNAIRFAGYSGEYGRFDSSGNLGIGTSSPAYKLDVSGTSARLGGGGSYPLYLVADSGGLQLFNASGGATGDGVYLNGASHYLGFYTNSSERMRLDSSGNLGIGTTGPSTKLQVIGTSGSLIDVAGSGAAGLQNLLSLRTSIGNSYGFQIKGNYTSEDYLIQNYYSGYLAFGTNNTERARIDSSGNLLVGTTSASLTNSNSQVFGGGANNYSIFSHVNGTVSGAVYHYFAYNGSSIGSITQNGTTGVLYNLTSDYRLKNNQQPLTGAKEFVMALQPKKWQWWDGSGEGVGFIAHEFMEVAKYSGHGEKDAVDADGNPVYQSIQPSSSEVIANLVALIQEQQALITDMAAKLKSAGVAGF